jgi:Rod binding domain-containing protein
VNAGYLQIADEQLAQHIVQSGGLGFAKSMADQMLKQIEAAKLIGAAQIAVK